MKGRPPDLGSGRNEQFPWNNFNSKSYHGLNFAELRGDDGEMLRRGTEWFAQSAMWRLSGGGAQFPHGVDVGAGPNLYPTLSMLGYCQKITIFEYSMANVEYLKREVTNLSDSWEPFWDVVSPFVGKRDFAWAKRTLRERAQVVQGNIFKDLPVGKFGIGTMFCCAESLSKYPQEVEDAIGNFLRSLMPGSPFVMGNVENSRGYWVGDQWFPATPVDVPIVKSMLDPLVSETTVEHLDFDGPPIHVSAEGKPVDDSTGFVLSTGLTQ